MFSKSAFNFDFSSHVAIFLLLISRNIFKKITNSLNQFVCWHHHPSGLQFSLDCCFSNKYMSFQEYHYECEQNWQVNKKFTQLNLTGLLASMCYARSDTRLGVKCVLSCWMIWIHATFNIAYTQWHSWKDAEIRSWRDKERRRKNMSKLTKYRLWTECGLVSYGMISISSVLLANLYLIRLTNSRVAKKCFHFGEF